MADGGDWIKVDRLCPKWRALSDDPGQSFVTKATQSRVQAGEIARYIHVSPEVYEAQQLWSKEHDSAFGG